MIRLAFFIHFNRTWLGGINVILNLINFLIMKKKLTNKIQIIIFTNSKENLKKYNLNKKIKIIEDNNFFDHNIFFKIIDKLFLIINNKTYFFEKLLIKYEIDFISHTNFVSGRNSLTKSIIWLPDFQYLYLPNLFSIKYKFLKYINLKIYKKCAYKILLSSYSTKHDLKKICNIPDSRIVVNNFVPKVTPKKNLKTLSYLKKKYKIHKKYFFLPNQYWVHKNHKIVIEALGKIKKMKKEIYVYSTGSSYDYRNPAYFKYLMDIIKEKKLRSNYFYLGVIPYVDVMSLMYHSLAVLNPSFFEGWSSTVEQAKAYNKNVILSDIKVHREQKPIKAFYFNPNNSNSLKNYLIDIYFKKSLKNKFTKTKKENYNKKINEYIDTYCDILNN